jgi:hypothetical protein
VPSFLFVQALVSLLGLLGVLWKILASIPNGMFCWAALRVLYTIHDSVTCSAISCLPLVTQPDQKLPEGRASSVLLREFRSLSQNIRAGGEQKNITSLTASSL